MLPKEIVYILLAAIIFSLGSALVFMLRDRGGTDSMRTVWALTFRIGLSVVLFLLLILGAKFGLIEVPGGR